MKKISAVLCISALLFTLGCTRKPAVDAPSTEQADTFQHTTESAAATACTTDEASAFSRPEPTVPATTKTTPSQSSSATLTQAQTTAPKETESVSTAQDEKYNVLDKIKDGLENVRITVPPKKSKDFFNDTVFVGDSVTLGLKNYTTSRRNKGEECLGTAQFLCCGSMSYTNALMPVSKDSLHPLYRGQKVSVEEGIRQIGARKAFIMLGMNDFSAYSEKTWRQSVRTFTDRILEKNPGLHIYIESVTPIVNGKEHGAFTNEKIEKFNAYLREFCAERGFEFVDISAQVMQDDSGHLKKSYCGDSGAMGIHMSNAGSDAWVQYLTAEFCGN